MATIRFETVAPKPLENAITTRICNEKREVWFNQEGDITRLKVGYGEG